MSEFERLLALYGSKYEFIMRQRAKDGDKSLHSSSSIQELLWLADDTIQCLAWLAKNRSSDCARHAARRFNWPGFISVLASINRKSREVVSHIPLGKDYKHIDWKRTEVDKLFHAALFINKYISKPQADSFSGVYYAPFIKGVLWMSMEERGAAIKKFNEKQGPQTRANWKKWKPLIARVVTLYYGPSSEKWKLIPNYRIPPKKFKFRKPLAVERVKLKTYRDICPAEIFGVLKEWIKYLSQKIKFSESEIAELQTWLDRQNKYQGRTCIMEIEPDEALKKIHARVERRDGGWGDFKSEILKRCFRLLPKN